MGLDDRADHLGFVSGPFVAVELVSFSRTHNTTSQLQLWATQMPILHIDPDYKRTVHPQSDRSDVSRGFMRDIPGFFKAPDISGRLIIRAVNDNPEPTYAFGRSLLKRMIVGLYCWHLLPVSVAQRAIDRLRIWGA